jgi:hypothetical protein
MMLPMAKQSGNRAVARRQLRQAGEPLTVKLGREVFDTYKVESQPERLVVSVAWIRPDYGRVLSPG